MNKYSSILRKFSHLLKDQDPLKVPKTWYRYGNGGYLHGDINCKKHVNVRVIESTALNTSSQKTCERCWHLPLTDILEQLVCLGSVSSIYEKLEFVDTIASDNNVTIERLGKCLHELDLVGLKLDALRDDSSIGLTSLMADYAKACTLVREYADSMRPNMPSYAACGTMVHRKDGIYTDPEYFEITDYIKSVHIDLPKYMHYAWCTQRVRSQQAAQQAALEVLNKYLKTEAYTFDTLHDTDGMQVPEKLAVANLLNFWETIYLGYLAEDSLQTNLLAGLRRPIVSDKVAGTFYIYGAKYGKDRQTSVCTVPPSVGRWLTHSTFQDKVLIVEDLVDVNSQCLDIVAAMWEPFVESSVYGGLRDTYSACSRV